MNKKKILIRVILSILMLPIVGITMNPVVNIEKDKISASVLEAESVEKSNSLDLSNELNKEILLEEPIFQDLEENEVSEEEKSKTENEANLEKPTDEEAISESEEVKEPSHRMTINGLTYTFEGTNGNSTATLTGGTSIPTNLVIPNQVTNTSAGWNTASPVRVVGDYAFEAKGLTSVTIPNSVTTIGIAAFRDNKLTNLNIPNSVITIRDGAFNWNSLSNLTLPNSVKTLEDHSLAHNNLTSVTIPNSVTSMGNQVFQGNSLVEVTVPGASMTMGTDIFDQNNIKTIYVASVDSNGIANVNIVKDQITPSVLGNITERIVLRSTPARYTTQTSLQNTKLQGESIQFEFDDTGFQLNNITDRVWQTYSPNNIKWFKDGKEITGQTAVRLNLSNLQVSDSGVYYATVGTERYPDIKLTVEGFTYTFSGTNASSTATVTGYSGTIPIILVIPSTAINKDAGWTNSSSVTSIGTGAFENKNLSSATIPSSVSNIGAQAFQTNNLTSVSIPSNVVTIGGNAFRNNQLTNVSIPNSVNSLGASSFRQNRLTSVSVSNSLSAIQESTFKDNQLTSITIPSNVGSIAFSAFEDNRLTNVSIPKVTSIGNSAFANNNLTEMILSTAVSTLGANIVTNNPLKTIYVVDSTTNLSEHVSVIGVKDKLTPSVIGAVTERTVLRSKVTNYTMETNLINTKLSGESIQFEADTGYQLNSTTNRIWETYNPDKIQWLKDGKELDGQKDRLLDLKNLQEVDAGIYNAKIGDEIYPSIKLNVELDIHLPIPPVNPDGSVIFPDRTNPNIEGLSLRYVSPLIFGTHEFSNKDEVYFSKRLKDTTGRLYSPMVTVQDMRTEADRSGWELFVSLEDNFANGAQIRISPYIDETYRLNLNVDVAQNKLIIGTDAKKFAGTLTTSNPSGIVSMGMCSSEDLGVELLVPGGVGVGSYSGVMNWELVSGP